RCCRSQLPVRSGERNKKEECMAAGPPLHFLTIPSFGWPSRSARTARAARGPAAARNGNFSSLLTPALRTGANENAAPPPPQGPQKRRSLGTPVTGLFVVRALTRVFNYFPHIEQQRGHLCAKALCGIHSRGLPARGFHQSRRIFLCVA